MKNIIAIVFFFFFSVPLLATQCIPPLTACETLHQIQTLSQIYPWWGEGRLVAKAKILNHQYHGLQIQLLDVIQGNETRDTVMLWGSSYLSTAMWRTDVSNFVTNDTMVVLIKRISSSPTDTLESEGDYIIPDCGVYYLYYHNGNVEGRITQYLNLAWESIPYNEFKAMVPYCYATGTATALASPTLAHGVAVYPNPFGQQLWVSGEQSVRLFDAVGRLVYAGSSAPNIPIQLGHLAAGIYYIETTASGGKTAPQVQKLLKL